MRLILTVLSILLLSACAKPAPQRESSTRYLYHTVTYPGETLGLIASWYTGSVQNWEEIANENSGIKANKIRIGDTVRIPEDLLSRREPLTKKAVEAYNRKVAPVDVKTGVSTTTQADAGPANDTVVNNTMTNADVVSNTATVAKTDTQPAPPSVDSAPSKAQSDTAAVQAPAANPQANPQQGAEMAKAPDMVEPVAKAAEAQKAAQDAAVQAQAQANAAIQGAQAANDTAKSPPTDAEKTRNDLIDEILKK